MKYLKYNFLLSLLFLLFSGHVSFCQENAFDDFNFLLGSWTGHGVGFGNDSSNIEASYQLVMNGTYIEVSHESYFQPTASKPEGERHIDKGFISFDKSRKAIVFRQFNNEGYINQYVLNDSLSTGNTFIFETENIENFPPNGKARWTLIKKSDTEIETIFDVSFPGREYTCFGTNVLVKSPR